MLIKWTNQLLTQNNFFDTLNMAVIDVDQRNINSDNIKLFSSISCEFCLLVSDGICPVLNSDFRIIYTLTGSISVKCSGINSVCSKGELTILSKEQSPELFPDSFFSAYFVDFSGKRIFEIIDLLQLKTGKIYNIKADNILSAFEQMETEFSLYINLGYKLSLAASIVHILTAVSRNVNSIVIPGDNIGIDGFSWKDIAIRKVGIFHGRKSIMVTPNVENAGIVVLENYSLADYKIDLKKFKYVQMSYYYESEETCQRYASIRILRLYSDEEHLKRDEYFSIYNEYYHNEFFVPIVRNRWAHATFYLDFSEDISGVIRDCSSALLRQIKINPFGILPAAELPPNDKMYISSITFYKEDPNILNYRDENKSILDVLDLMNEHYNQDKGLNFYADACFLSVSRFSHWFKQQMGMSPAKYINDLRIGYAKSYLTAYYTNSIEYVSRQCGYKDQHYFSRVFKKNVGMTPTEYRKNLKIKNKKFRL